MSTKPYIYKRTETGEKVAYRNDAYWKPILEKKYDLLLKNSGIPPFYWSIDFKDYKGDLSRDNLKKVIQYSKECFSEKFDYVNLYVWCDSNSSQKTAVCCNVGKEAIRQGKRVKFILAGTLLDLLLKNSGFNYSEEINYKINELKNADMLIVDDIFDSKKSIHWQNSDLIVAEIDKFFRELLVTNIKIVMTSNVNPKEILKKYGNSIFELIDRNFVSLVFQDGIKKERKKHFENLFDEEIK